MDNRIYSPFPVTHLMEGPHPLRIHGLGGDTVLKSL